MVAFPITKDGLPLVRTVGPLVLPAYGDNPCDCCDGEDPPTVCGGCNANYDVNYTVTVSGINAGCACANLNGSCQVTGGMSGTTGGGSWTGTKLISGQLVNFAITMQCNNPSPGFSTVFCGAYYSNIVVPQCLAGVSFTIPNCSSFRGSRTGTLAGSVGPFCSFGVPQPQLPTITIA